MVNYLLKILYLLVVSFVVIFTYYFTFSFHTESFSGYTPYVIALLIFYFVYKGYTLFFYKEVLKFKIINLFGFFLLQLLTLSIIFFTLNGNMGAAGINLFFTCISYMILPILSVIISISFGKFILSKIPKFNEESQIFQFLLSLGFGFFSFITILTLFAFFGFYNLISLFGIFIVFIGVSYKEFLGVLKSIYTYEFTVDNHKKDGNEFERVNMHLLTSELLFIILTFLISVNLINIVRPMPIGWDDLGVYMNYPQMLANAGEMLPLGGLLSWQIFTGIGYMFKSATQAFFLNNVGGILSVLVIILSFSDLLKSKAKTFINIPLLSACIFISMPMIIFEQAKDMKVDPGLFFVSSIVIYASIYLFLKYLENKNEDVFSNKNYLIYLFVIGILAGFAFSIKLTSLLLISGIIGILFYAKLGLLGLFSYITFYIGIFTKFGLWDMLNVVYPKDDIAFRNYVFIGSIIIGLIFLGLSIFRYKILSFKRLSIIFLVFMSGVFISLSPWFIRNIFTLDGQITITGIINGKAETFVPDYTKIHSQEKIDEIKREWEAQQIIDTSGTTINEDLGRYFGYENGINNYVKLPYNLTMQTNQKGEFTDITYIFLALLPVIILFLSFSSKVGTVGYFLMSLFPFLFFFSENINKTIGFTILPDFNVYLSEIFSKLTLPTGYLVFALFFLIPFLYLIFFLDKKKSSLIFKLNLVFATFYVFLWSISAFGIVWYGIAMYYSFLLIIALGLKYVSSYDYNEEFKFTLFKFFGSFVAFLLISFYFFNSSFPHGFSNLKGASYPNYKAGGEKQYVSIFNAHSDYFPVLVELNITPSKREELFNQIKGSVKNEILKNILSSTKNIFELEDGLNSIANLSADQAQALTQAQFTSLKNEVGNLRNELYYNVLYPKKDFQNNAGVYRIGTFLRYFIVNNYNRLLDDSLVFEFGRYIYDKENVDVGVDRMKQLGIDYFLVDLNAATIDRDPRRDLTRRYENLLKTFTSSKLELVSTDSLCLKTSLETYNKSQKTQEDLEEFMINAGVNYESYDENGTLTLNRGEKQLSCYNKILDLIQDDKVSSTDYAFLVGVKNYIETNKISSQEELLSFFTNYVGHGWMVLFKIK